MKQIIFSGVQPSGTPTLGNYIGAIRNWVAMQDEYDCIYSVVNMHAITVRRDPTDLRRQTLELMALLLAAGLTPEKSTLFVQSMVPGHAELQWVLNCYTQFGELSRMTQFKEKSARHADNINAGLFDYPVLMASDILLYGAHRVPVGEDQKQHVELSRDVALRFNGVYGEVLTIPEPFIPKVGARVMSLTEPERKMDKSADNQNSYILLTDSPDDILRKFKKAVTDSEGSIRFDPKEKPGVSNLMTIYSVCTGLSFEQIEAAFAGKGYGAFKPAVGEAVSELLRPIREEVTRLLDDEGYLMSVIRQGAEKADKRAQNVLKKVRDAIGFIQ